MQTTSTRPKRKQLSWQQEEAAAVKKHRLSVISRGINMYLKAHADSSSGTLQRNTVKNILKQLGSPAWLTRHHLYYHIKKIRHQATVSNQTNSSSETEHSKPKIIEVPEADDDKSTITSVTTQTDPCIDSVQNKTNSILRKKGGRPQGSSLKTKFAESNRLQQARNLAAVKFDEARKEAKKTKKG